MRFRPLRSRAFWLGLPGLVFLLWGWWVSMGHFSVAGTQGVKLWGIGQTGGEVFAVWSSDGWPSWRKFDVVHEVMPVEGIRHWRMTLAAGRESDPAFRYVLIPYGWPVIGYGALWAGLMLWRREKYRRSAPAAEGA
jgi:hypothetical protein